MRTLLVANRGEIARRVIRAARAEGMRTVAVYTDPDAGSPHVADADTAVALGGPGGYLDAAAIVAAARAAGADAVHPGYGFLAENADFATACERAGVTFVGPSAAVIRAMGVKHEAKALAEKAGVPVLPGDLLTGDDPDGWQRTADKVGFPLLVKASAGGGGTGMRLVSSPDELAEAVASARREAASAFGDSTVFCERYLPAPRHIEVQVFGDGHGTVVHLLERECSIQRRHQKVIEECPSPAVGPQLRERLGGTAVALASALDYVGAGTVEFLLDDATGEYFFLEMNTRLQVEHPVTEEVTGLDLVRLQLRVARGEPLPFGQADVRARGHAIEARLYAEDPARDWAPAPGRLWTYAHSGDDTDAEGLRWEDGVAGGSVVSTFYDPMLAKVVAHADTRAQAAARLAHALAGMRLHGPRTNRDTLAALLTEPDFLAGRTRTDYLPTHPDVLTAGPPDPVAAAHLAAAIAVAVHRRTAGGPAVLAPPGWRLVGSGEQRAEWADERGETREVRYRLAARGGDTSIEVGGERYALRALGPDGVWVAGPDGSGIAVERRCSVTVTGDGTYWVNDVDWQTGWTERPRFAEAAGAVTAAGPVSEVPGTVTEVLVQVGDRIAAGQPLVLLEAMKMEHRALAGADGVVEAVNVTAGQYVDAHEVLVVLATEEES
jgi:propionyl-CoA carboxylase alpha chain